MHTAVVWRRPGSPAPEQTAFIQRGNLLLNSTAAGHIFCVGNGSLTGCAPRFFYRLSV